MFKKINFHILFLYTIAFTFIPLLANKERLLLQAIIDNDLSLVEELLAKGASLAVQNDYGNTPLHFAAHYGHIQIVRYLIKMGADIYAKNNDGDIPVYVAKKLSIVNILLEKEWFDDMDKYMKTSSRKEHYQKSKSLLLLKKISLSSSLAGMLHILKQKLN